MNRLRIFAILMLFIACKSRQQADAVYYNGKVYTVDSAFTVAEAFAVKDGKILATGSTRDMMAYDSREETDLQGASVYPGFYDAHCHFYGYGVDLNKINLTGTASFRAVLDTLVRYRNKTFMGWLFGRGWDQNDWNGKEYPDRRQLDSLFPDVPVFLLRIDGHAALVNQAAMDRAGIRPGMKISGGEVEVKNGRLTGILIDNAVDSVKIKIPLPGRKMQTDALLQAEKNCFAVGLTTVADAGLDKDVILLVDSLQQSGALKMRYYAMISWNSENKAYFFKRGKIKTPSLTVSSFKVYADGALGSRGACLREPYSDRPGHYGFLLSPADSLEAAAMEIAAHGFQLNTHCIGDSAVRTLLNMYHHALQGKTDQRWRIEHAQVLDPDAFDLFRNDGIIPSVQPTHATSDMYWAPDRLGPERIKGAYAYRRLKEAAGLIAAGSDFPVEDINPLYGFYAAVSRKDKKNFPEGGFQHEQALSREDALRAMTIWAAFSCFEEKEKGSLEAGKYADFVILKKDIMVLPEEELWQVNVSGTFVNGIKVY